MLAVLVTVVKSLYRNLLEYTFTKLVMFNFEGFITRPGPVDQSIEFLVASSDQVQTLPVKKQLIGLKHWSESIPRSSSWIVLLELSVEQENGKSLDSFHWMLQCIGKWKTTWSILITSFIGIEHNVELLRDFYVSLNINPLIKWIFGFAVPKELCSLWILKNDNICICQKTLIKRTVDDAGSTKATFKLTPFGFPVRKYQKEKHSTSSVKGLMNLAFVTGLRGANCTTWPYGEWVVWSLCAVDEVYLALTTLNSFDSSFFQPHLPDSKLQVSSAQGPFEK